MGLNLESERKLFNRLIARCVVAQHGLLGFWALRGHSFRGGCRHGAICHRLHKDSAHCSIPSARTNASSLSLSYSLGDMPHVEHLNCLKCLHLV